MRRRQFGKLLSKQDKIDEVGCFVRPHLLLISFLMLSLAAFVVALLDNLPVEHLPEGLYSFSTGIAVVDVVGVLPYVDSEQRVQTLSKWSACILCADDI